VSRLLLLLLLRLVQASSPQSNSIFNSSLCYFQHLNPHSSSSPFGTLITIIATASFTFVHSSTALHVTFWHTSRNRSISFDWIKLSSTLSFACPFNHNVIALPILPLSRVLPLEVHCFIKIQLRLNHLNFLKKQQINSVHLIVQASHQTAPPRSANRVIP
jgi:hypothetical protein